mgnify:CR=1 FL=1
MLGGVFYLRANNQGLLSAILSVAFLSMVWQEMITFEFEVNFVFL